MIDRIPLANGQCERKLAEDNCCPLAMSNGRDSFSQLNLHSNQSTSSLKRRKAARGVFVFEITEARELGGKECKSMELLSFIPFKLLFFSSNRKKIALFDAYVKIKHEGIVGNKKWNSSTQHKTTNPKWPEERCVGYDCFSFTKTNIFPFFF